MATCKEFKDIANTFGLVAGNASYKARKFASHCTPLWMPALRSGASIHSFLCSKGLSKQCMIVDGFKSMCADYRDPIMMQVRAAETDLASVKDIFFSSVGYDDSSVPTEQEEKGQPPAQPNLEEAPGEQQEKGQTAFRAAGIFPGGFRRAEVRLPGLALVVTAADVLGSRAKEFLVRMDSAVAGGCTMVILGVGGGTGNDEASGGAKIYEAARLLKATLRGRAELLVSERVDIAAAAGASGVLLSDEGLPAVVARSMMQNVGLESPVLPLVARSVRSVQSAMMATASEGADLLILQTEDIYAEGMISSICEGISIPIFLRAPLSLLSADSSMFSILEAGANGFVFDGDDLRNIATEKISSSVSAMIATMNQSVQQRSSDAVLASSSSLSRPTPNKAIATMPVNNATSPTSVDLEAEKILEEERDLLMCLIELIREASPEMEEISLLVDAVAQLDEPFLLMVVGEFNSGKSSVINSLLGKRYLNEGVLPTTNEIALLKHAGSGNGGKERSERHPDGHFVHYLSSQLLKQMNLVDTPGTNVILKRQQRLTEEFVPRADLVLFVLSADRPFTESEMTFLRYIRQWDKKIIFLLNKSDIYSDKKELEEVVKFVQDNAQRLLSVEEAIVYPVSARKSLQAKIEASNGNEDPDIEKLRQSSTWESSGFDKLESFIWEFLGGSSDAGAERRRLKLATPLGIALALLEACERQLVTQAEKAASDVDVLNGLRKQLEACQRAVETDAVMRHQVILAQVDAVKVRAQKFVDVVLRLSNVDAMARYLLGGDRKGRLPVNSGFDQQVMGSAQYDIERLLEEHRSWIKDTLQQQVSKYKEVVISRWPTVHLTAKDKHPVVEWGLLPQNGASKKQGSMDVMDGFDTQAAKIVLEQEIREVVVTTFGGLGLAGVSASVLTSILPNTIEDLVALGICSAGGFVGVWNLPNRRAEVKRKIQKVAESFASQMESAMKAEVKEGLEKLGEEVGEVMEPYCKAAEAEATRVSSLQRRVKETISQIEELRLTVQNLGIS